MSKLTSIFSCLTLALGVGLPAAQAEQVIYRNVPSGSMIRYIPGRTSQIYMAPTVRTQSVVIPSSTLQRIITVPARADFITPGTIMRRSAVIMPSVAPVTTTTSTITTESTLRSPQFMKRLSNMAEQINLAESRGWLTSDELSSLRSEQSRLSSLLDSSNVGGLTKTEIDELERNWTSFNQQIQAELHD